MQLKAHKCLFMYQSTTINPLVDIHKCLLLYKQIMNDSTAKQRCYNIKYSCKQQFWDPSQHRPSQAESFNSLIKNIMVIFAPDPCTCLELVAPPIERFQKSFTHVVQHCYETYSVSFIMIGQTVFDLQSDLQSHFFAFVVP